MTVGDDINITRVCQESCAKLSDVAHVCQDVSHKHQCKYYVSETFTKCFGFQDNDSEQKIKGDAEYDFTSHDGENEDQRPVHHGNIHN